MAHLGEFLGRLAAHALSGAVGRDQFRVIRFQLAQFSDQFVVGGVADDGRVEDVIAVIVEVDLPAEFGHASLHVGHAIPPTCCVMRETDITYHASRITG
jgi:hypothetical protein